MDLTACAVRTMGMGQLRPRASTTIIRVSLSAARDVVAFDG
jgi:hypothetical protein